LSYWIDIVFLLFFLAMNSTYSLLIALSVIEVVQRKATRMLEIDRFLMTETSAPPISILTPAYNEEAGIVDSVLAFLSLEYPNLQVIVINDGSKDKTLEKLKDRFDLEPVNLVIRNQIKTKPVRAAYQSLKDPRLIVVDKENGGKAEALNVGLNVCRTPLVCCVDADSLIDRHALLRMVEPYLYDESHVIGVGGTVHLANGCLVKEGKVQKAELPASWIARFQVLEYLRAFLFGRMGFNRLGGNLIISGAFGLFLRDAIIQAGGYTRDTVGEDMEIVVRLHKAMREARKKYRIIYIPDPVCYTEAPETFAILRKQRDRWQRGLIETLERHKDMFFNPRFGRVGFIVFPFFVFFEFLGPLIEFFGY
jgi:cellulose synthase/poly-beta-1,6-N-acetylglucosamine synthase-like glycosyltransferase